MDYNTPILTKITPMVWSHRAGKTLWALLLGVALLAGCLPQPAPLGSPLSAPAVAPLTLALPGAPNSARLARVSSGSREYSTSTTVRRNSSNSALR